MRMIGRNEAVDDDEERVRIIPALRGGRSCRCSKFVQRTRVQEKPKSIARVKALFTGGMESRRVSASPRGQRTNGVSIAKSCASPCVNAMPAERAGRRRAAKGARR